ncbi:MAG: hypothetical protein ACREAA_12595 [Candidatus Polarisedimenticolia bacterium]
MRRALEFLMYLAFSAAALPFAWLGVNDILYYRAHPDMLEVMDSAPEVLGVMAAIWVMGPALAAGAVLALYFLIAGPRAARVSSAVLTGMWLVPFLAIPATPARSFARLYWDGLPFVALSVLPWVCAGVRLANHDRRKLCILLACGMLFLLPGAVPGQTAQRTPVVTTPHFAFYSDFDTNLNDALIAAGLARKKDKPELFHAGDEASCFEKLVPSARAAWEGAVAYYAQIISPSGWMARQQFLIRMHLVGFGDERPAERDVEFLEIARSFRAAAAPAYRACRWAMQDDKNRAWIADVQKKLGVDEERVAARVEQLYQKPWKVLPILVDVVETVDWSGANTSWSDSGQGNVLIANSPQGAAGFEVLIHEASHVLMDRSDPVRQALERAAKAAAFSLPDDLWHVVLFYTTGEAVRGVLDGSGPSGYTPMLYELFKGGSWVQYREALEQTWRPYVDGKRSLDAAATDLIAALRPEGSTKQGH